MECKQGVFYKALDELSSNGSTYSEIPERKKYVDFFSNPSARLPSIYGDKYLSKIERYIQDSGNDDDLPF